MSPSVGFFVAALAVIPVFLMSLSMIAGRAGDRFAQGASALTALVIWMLDWNLVESASGEVKASQDAIAIAAIGCVLSLGHALVANRCSNLKARIGVDVSHFFIGEIDRRTNRVTREQHKLGVIAVGDLPGVFTRQSDLKIYLDSPARNRSNVLNSDTHSSV
jgi:hypothetical protein